MSRYTYIQPPRVWVAHLNVLVVSNPLRNTTKEDACKHDLMSVWTLVRVIIAHVQEDILQRNGHRKIRWD